MWRRIVKYFILVVIIILFSVNRGFGETEEEVMKRYDFSSPRASYESFKKALQANDFYGVCIHHWWDIKLMLPDQVSQMSFQEFASQTDKTSIMEFSNKWYSSNGGKWIKLTETEFLKELEREHSKGSTGCGIIVQRKSEGNETKVATFNLDGTSEWWVIVFTGLEDNRMYSLGEDGKWRDENGVEFGQNAK
jgi:hypothetical protein